MKITNIFFNFNSGSSKIKEYYGPKNSSLKSAFIHTPLGNNILALQALFLSTFLKSIKPAPFFSTKKYIFPGRCSLFYSKDDVSLVRMRISSLGSIPPSTQKTDATGGSAMKRQEIIVIIGGGIIGSSIAYHLSRVISSAKGEDNPAPSSHPKVILIERECIAASASGKAGGFLAGGWGDGSVTQQLHRISFDLHERYAAEFGLTSYRKIATLSVDASSYGNRSSKKADLAESWIRDGVARELMDDKTAQVDPKELTEAFAKRAQEAGVSIQIGTVKGIVKSPEPNTSADELQAVQGVLLEDGSIVKCDKVIVAMGVWSTIASEWLDLPLPLEGVKSTSLLFKNVNQRNDPTFNEPFALFCAEDKNGCHLEVYPRLNGDVYICGCGGSDYVKGSRLMDGGDCADPKQIHADPKRVSAATKSFFAITSMYDSYLEKHDGHQEVQPEIQACMRPCAPDALPILGKVPHLKGAYVAAGHNCWGILWAPVTGLAMAELVLEGSSRCVDLNAFAPNRFVQHKQRGTRGRHRQNLQVGEQW